MQEPIRIELPTIYGMKTVNTYLFLEPIPTLIDCGEDTDQNWEALQKQLGEHGLQIQDIQRLIITHAHVDHIGMASRIATNSNAQVWVNEYCYPWATDKEKMWEKRGLLIEQMLSEDVSLLPFLKKMLLFFKEGVGKHWRDIPVEKIRTYPMEGQLAFGGGIWEILYVPGHANMQTCFYHAEKQWLLSADMLLKITPTTVLDNSITEPNKRDKGLIQLLDSYKKIDALNIKKVFPGHYEPFDNPHEVIQTQVSRIQGRIQECLGYISKGQHTLMELLQAMYANRITMPAMFMLIGYLDILLEGDKVKKQQLANGSIGYFLV